MIKKALLRFTLYAIIIYLIGGALNPALAVTHPLARNGTHFCGVIDDQWNKRYSDQFPNRHYARRAMANLNVGEPRTVRMIYFLPNDRPYRAEVVQKMKDDILKVQAFFAEQMEAHGYGKRTFRIETDTQGEPIVHRVDGRHPDSHYLDTTEEIVIGEIEQTFNFHTTNHYLVVVDNSIDALGGEYGGQIRGEAGGVEDKAWGYGIVDGGYNWRVAAHELGHAFGLWHDFRDSGYLMSWGPGQNQLSTCHAAFLAVHPYFNPNIPVEEGSPPTIELISPRTYPADSQSVLVRLKISDSEGLHWGILFIGGDATKAPEVKACRGLAGKKDFVVEFGYDGVIPSNGSTNLSSPMVHPIRFEVIDTNGNVSRFRFVLFSETLQPLTKISGDNLQGLPNTPLPVPFVVELRDLNNGFPRHGVWVTFTVTAGGGTLSVEHVKTDYVGRAESTLTLGPNLGTNTVEVYAEGRTVTFNAIAGGAVDIPDPYLRAAIKTTFGKAPGTPIAPAELAALTRLDARNANISDLTGLQYATNLTELWLGGRDVEGEYVNSNTVSDLSPLAGLTNLTRLNLWGNNISDLSPVVGLTNLTGLWLGWNNISDISSVAGLTNLTDLGIEGNNISDLSPVAGLTNLTWLNLGANTISDLSPVAGLTNLTWLNLGANAITDISLVAGLTQLNTLYLWHNDIADISPLVANTGLGGGDTVDLRGNPLNYLSIYTHIPALQNRGVTVEFDNRTPAIPLKISGDNQEGAPSTILEQSFAVDVQDQNGEAFAGVPVVFTVTEGGGVLSITSTVTDANGRAKSTLTLGPNPGTNTVEFSVEGISQRALFRAEAIPPPPKPTTLEYVSGDNQSGLIGETLMQSFVVEVHDQYDDPMEGVTVTFVVSIGGGSMSDTNVDSDVNGLARSTLTLSSEPGTNIVEASVESIAETVTFNAVAELLEFDLDLPLGISLIHVPLNVTTVDGVPKIIDSIGDLYDALGGASKVTFLTTYDSQTQDWVSYFGAVDKDTTNRELTVDTGILANMIAPASIRLRGSALGTNGTSTINLNRGINVVGLPLDDSRIRRVGDLFKLDGIDGNVPVITLTDGGEFKTVGRVGDPGDIEITGGQAFIMTAQRAAMVDISGEGWTNPPETAAVPPMLTGIQVTDTTPVLGLKGLIVEEETGLNKGGFRITAKNLSTGKAAAAVTAPDTAGYRHIIVDMETGRAATVGDILEISAKSADPFIGVKLLRYTVTTEDVKRSLIQLPALVAYEIPAETELLTNYPNPFNPETWIPYRLAEDAFVTLTIYDGAGQVVRALDVGHRIASAYENRSKAVYWDGRNALGEQVASGVYFYTLSAGDFSATRKMLILK